MTQWKKHNGGFVDISLHLFTSTDLKLTLKQNDFAECGISLFALIDTFTRRRIIIKDMIGASIWYRYSKWCFGETVSQFQPWYQRSGWKTEWVTEPTTGSPGALRHSAWSLWSSGNGKRRGWLMHLSTPEAICTHYGEQHSVRFLIEHVCV